MFSKNQNQNKKQNFGNKQFKEFKGKKYGKEYFEYVEDCKRKQELLIKQRLQECKSNDATSNGLKEGSITEDNIITNVTNIHAVVQPSDIKVEKKGDAISYNSNESCVERSKYIINDSVKLESNIKVENKPKPELKGSESVNVKNESGLFSEYSKHQFKEVKPKEEPDKLIVPEDPKVLIAIENLVSQVSVLPKYLQKGFMKQLEDQEEYWFLTLVDSVEFTYFHWRLKDFEEAKSKTEESVKSYKEKVEMSEGRKKRKSRWSAEPVQAIMVSVLNQIPGSQVLTDSQKMQMNYQKELQAMQEFIHAQQKAKVHEVIHCDEVVKCRPTITKLDQCKYEYDSDEDTSGGTWEHKLRESEMEATRVMADKLTEMGQGRHHIGDFLPPEELFQFMETFQALKEGRKPEFSDFNNFKITCENVGFKMLQKMGWKEGEGLGNDGKGIITPIESAPLKSDTLGVGVSKTAKLSKYDDEYDAYRKRMMLAYRFRPNPLNNPRRDYY